MDKATNPHGSPVNIDNRSELAKYKNVSLHYSAVAPTPTQWVLLIQLEGSSDYAVNQDPITLHKGDACLLRPTDYFRSQSNGRCLSFLVDMEYVRSLSSLLDGALYEDLSSSPESLRFSLSDNLLSSLAQKTAQLGTPQTIEYNRSCILLFQELYIQFLTQHLYTPPKYPEWLTNLIVTLHDTRQFGLPLSQLASTTPYSYSRLTRVFKHYTGVSLIDYVTDIKLRYAKQLLSSTDMTMLAIASSLEFSVSYFNKLFKRKTGVTPGEYRRTHRKI